MNYTIFMLQTFTDTFHVIVDTVSCIMRYGFDILSDVFGHYSGIYDYNRECRYSPVRRIGRYYTVSKEQLETL